MKLSVKGQLQLAVRAAFAAGAAVLMASPAVVQAQDAEAESDEPVELEKFVATGSRLSRASVEGSLPVTVIDRETIELSGEISVADLLRNTSYNTFGSFKPQSGSSAQSFAGLDLRGLGSSRTLILIDGKRAPKSPFVGSAQDLNAIPLAAVERIEILKDGASAIYGSEAVAGVVNVILRTDFEGVEMSYGVSRPEAVDGGDTETGSVLFGVNGDRGNLIGGASFNRRTIIYDSGSIFADAVGASVFSNNYVGFDQEGNFQIGPVPGGCDDPNFYVSTTTGLCAYDFTAVAANEAAISNMSLFVKGRYEISETWDTYSTMSIARAESFGRYAPTPAILFVPGDAPTNPLGFDIYVYHRYAALGNRDNITDGNVYDALVGFQGSFGPVEMDFGARYNEYKAYELGRNYAVTPIANQFAADGTYDFVNPLNNSADVLSAMKATINREATWRTEEVFATASMDLFQLPGGMAGVAIGGEYRTEDYADIYDSLQEAGVIGGSAGNSAAGGRNVRSYFGEFLLPVLSNLEFDLAVRYDDYSDYGNDTSPKASVRFQPVDKLTLRASYGQGFRAPDLPTLTQQPAFSATPVNNDQPTCEFFGFFFDESANTCFVSETDDTVQEIQVDTIIVSNSELASEQSDQYSLGFAADPTSWLNITADYYNIQIDDLISYISASDIIAAEISGDPIPAGLGLTRLANQGNRIDEVTAGFANEGTLETEGVDVNIVGTFNLGAAGRIRSDLQAVQVLSYTFDGGRDQIGDPGLPELRATWLTSWSFSDFNVAWNQSYIDSTAQTVNSEGQQTGEIEEWWTHDIRVSYTAPWNGTISVGALNFTDEEPPESPFDGRPYNFYLYDQYGRVPYFEYTQRF